MAGGASRLRTDFQIECPESSEETTHGGGNLISNDGPKMPRAELATHLDEKRERSKSILSTPRLKATLSPRGSRPGERGFSHAFAQPRRGNDFDFHAPAHHPALRFTEGAPGSSWAGQISTPRPDCVKTRRQGSGFATNAELELCAPRGDPQTAAMFCALQPSETIASAVRNDPELQLFE